MGTSSNYSYDIWGWMQSIPPISQWKGNSMSICICPSTSTQPSLLLYLARNLPSSSSSTASISCTITVDFKVPISLWTSNLFQIKTATTKVVDDKTLSKLFSNFVTDVLRYGPHKTTSFLKIYAPPLNAVTDLKDMFNLSFSTLTFLVCIYEAPQGLRSGYLNTLKNHLTSSESREALKTLMRLLGSNTEEQWMRSLNLAITNWIIELKTTNHGLRSPSSMFSYSISNFGLWKVQLYCPVISMNIESSSPSSAPERLYFSFVYHQLEGVFQLGYKVVITEKWIDVKVNLVSEALMMERGVGSMEKHFPSRIRLQLTPTAQNNVLSVSVGRSSENPTREIGIERGIEGGFDVPSSLLGLKVSVAETSTMNMKPWKFEQSVSGNSVHFDWSLHDSVDGREVIGSRPSKFAFVQSRPWFKDRYSSAYRPFNKQGGVVFARDEYGESICWKVDRKAIGRTMEWEIKGWIWLTYWPNKYTTLYTETRKLEFKEILHLPLL
ncbi:hypothetical protein ACHQM5_027792 [Ranunculus cassubicifolius]